MKVYRLYFEDGEQEVVEYSDEYRLFYSNYDPSKVRLYKDWELIFIFQGVKRFTQEEYDPAKRITASVARAAARRNEKCPIVPVL